MKTKYFLMAAVAAFTLYSCVDQEEGKTEDPAIQITPDKIDAPWEGSVTAVEITANCTWNVSKTGADGSAIDWVKCDKTTGKDDSQLSIKVDKNPYGEPREATVTVFSGDVKAFVAVTQAANPDPSTEEPPTPKPQILELSFDFTQALEGWPTNKDQSWADLKNCDSGCATDNGGEEVATNSHRRAQVTYTLDGAGYDFTLADPNGAQAHNIYLGTDGLYSGTLRYFGLPAIEGKKLVKVEMEQNASNKDPEKFTRNVGVAKWVYHKDVPVDQIQYVDGGEPQNQAVTVEGTVYTYELSGTAPNTVYWMNSPTNASKIKSLKLYYAQADGTEEPLGDEPADPTPEPDPDPDPDPDPVDPNALELTFDFTGTPQEGWPTAKRTSDHNPGVGTPCTYVLNEVPYVFMPADCGGASASQVFWVPPTDEKAGYFAINAQYRYLGLPIVEGHKLVKVVCHNVALSSTAPKMGITSLINQTAAHPADDAYVAGGALQTWDAAGGGTYTYELSGTDAAARYYLYGYAKGAIDILTLTYNPIN